ncbi:MAG: radical SAM protein [Elusimicrobia bacterium]|nr:radical SAM protein [Elusimicrobiota bacterium]
MKDNFGRTINYARISLTDRCNLRCRYCMPEEGIQKFSHRDILRFEEIGRVIKILQKLGVKKFRFTGGEPFVRKGAIDFFEKLNFPFNITTNLTAPGLDIGRINRLNLESINVSCDSLNAEKYRYITRWGDLNIFLENFRKLNVKNIKLNVLAIKNFNEDEIADFIKFALEFNVTVRFIEKMDFIDDGLEFMSLSPVKKRLISQGIIEKRPLLGKNSVAVYHRIKNSKAKVGFIAPESESFCAKCDKIRIQATGDVKLCLFDRRSYSAKKLLRGGFSDEEIQKWFEKILKNKKFAPSEKKGATSIAALGG